MKTNFLKNLDALAFWLRRWPRIHRVGRWGRRVFWAAVVEGFWEFCRHLFAKVSRFGPPAKVSSVYQALRCGWPKLKGRIVLLDQGVPRGIRADALIITTGLNQHAEQPWPILWSEHTNAHLVGPSHGLLLADKELCAESIYGYVDGRWQTDPASRFFRLPAPTKLAGNWTSLVSRWVPAHGVPVYGHWLQDALPRLALLPEFPADTGILVPANLTPIYRETLALLGVWDRCRPTRERHLEIERYFFSSPTSMIDCYNPYAINFLRTAYLPKRDPQYSGPKKFYFHRTSKQRAVENGAEVCEFFRQHGWAVIRDTELNFAQTVKLFSEAEAFCSVIGSNMVNMAFCQPGCHVVDLAPDILLSGCIDWIGEVAQADYHIVVLPTGGAYTHRIVIDLELVKQFFDSVGIAL
jgi:capsular polysaccharide biosynthesis protein